MPEMQFESGRHEASVLFDQFLNGRVTIKKTSNPAKLDYMMHQQPTTEIAKAMLENIIELTHFYALQWLKTGEPPTWEAMRRNCERYIEMRKRKESR